MNLKKILQFSSALL